MERNGAVVFPYMKILPANDVSKLGPMAEISVAAKLVSSLG